MWCRSLVVILLLGGCTAAYRTQRGGATTRDGVSSGTTSSLYFSDRGGLLTRAGLIALGLAAAAGSVENVRSTSTVSDNGDGTVTVHTRTTGTFNAATAAAASDILAAASDPHQNYDGLTGGLEIASTSLGGDTSGWMFEFGYAYATTFHSRWGFEGSAKFGFGGFTQHDRMISTFDTTSSDMGVVRSAKGDGHYDFLGFPIRAGITYHITPTTTIEPFVKLEWNLYPVTDNAQLTIDPSPWHFGGRLTVLDYVYVEGDVRFSALRESARSYGLEVGVAF